jgi:pentatricopeptide repeat protein
MRIINTYILLSIYLQLNDINKALKLFCLI